MEELPMNGAATVLALSDNQSAWVATLVAGVVVLLVVIILLEILRRAVVKLERSIWRTWENGLAVVQNTATTYQLKSTRDSSEELVEELGNHG